MREAAFAGEVSAVGVEVAGQRRPWWVASRIGR
jgi:hypothetical protein